MPQFFWILIVGLVIFAWFLLGEKTTFVEKITFLGICVFIYVFYKFLSGKTPHEILESFKQFFS